jgi:D-aminopeptidase
MICHGFKGGIGTASRVVHEDAGGYTVGVLVQANHGGRRPFRVDGVPVGEAIGERIPLPGRAETARGGSIIVLVATDAPLLPGQCDRLAQRAALGIGRVGGMGEHSSGDLILAFATGNRGLGALEQRPAQQVTVGLEAVAHAHVNVLFEAAIAATEEAILNALLAAETMTGRAGNTAYGLDAEVLAETLARVRPA